MEYKLELTPGQLAAFRRLQADNFTIAMRNDSTELLKHQELIESWVRGQIDLGVTKATMTVGTMPGLKMAVVKGGGSLTKEQTIEFRTLQADAYAIANRLDTHSWIAKQLEIENWVALQIETAVVRACQHLITKVRGN
jgi:hypothetical protein